MKMIGFALCKMKSFEVENENKRNEVKRKIMNWEIFSICMSKDTFPQCNITLSLEVLNALLIMLNI